MRGPAAAAGPAIAAKYSPAEVLSPLAVELRATVNKVLLITENHDTSASDLFKLMYAGKELKANFQRYLVKPCAVQLGEFNTNDFCSKTRSDLGDARGAVEESMRVGVRESALTRIDMIIGNQRGVAIRGKSGQEVGVAVFFLFFSRREGFQGQNTWAYFVSRSSKSCHSMYVEM